MIAGTCCRDAVLLPLYSTLYRRRFSCRTRMTSQIERSKRHGSTLVNAVIAYVMLLLLIQVFTLKSHMHLTYPVVASLCSFSCCCFCQNVFNDLWAVDLPAGATWRQIPTSANFPLPRIGHSAVAMGSRILIYGGRNLKTGAAVFRPTLSPPINSFLGGPGPCVCQRFVPSPHGTRLLRVFIAHGFGHSLSQLANFDSRYMRRK